MDTLGLDAARRTAWLALARDARRCRVSRSPSTPRPRCAASATAPGHDRSRPTCSPRSCARGPRPGTRSPARASTGCWRPSRCGWCPPAFAGSARGRASASARSRAPGCGSALHIGEFPAAAPGLRAWVRTTGQAAEEAGFDAVYVMDHFRQIPQVGRAWDDFLESLHHAGVPRRVHRAGAAGRARHRHHVPQRRAPGEDRGHAGRAQRWPRGLRAGPGVVRGRARRVRLAVPVRPRSATPCSRTRCSCCRCCGVLGARRSTAGSSTCPRRSATRDRCRSTCRSSSAVAASGAPCASPRSTPTPPTSSATSRRCDARPRSCASTARPAAGTSPCRTCPPPWSAPTTGTSPSSSTRAVRADGRRPPTPPASTRARSQDHVGRIRELADAGVGEVVLRLVDPQSMEPMARVIARFREEAGP